ncbi:MAG: UDP-N-acetylmuramate--L-alanine ligase [Anaerolineales bacterium]
MSQLSAYKLIHIVGIGGAGMSAIARVLEGRGIAVQGSDRREGPLIADLRAEGIPVVVGHAPEHVQGVDLVLASSAVPEENPELAAARAQGTPVMRRPDFLPLLTAGYDVIAVAGAHGKTTVTGMITTVLLEAGRDPTYIVGGVVENLGTNAHAGEGPLFVIEADEYQNTFLSLEPKIAVITNIEFDHPDSFPSPRFLRLAFGNFVEQIQADGALVACNDDEVAHAVGACYHANGGRLRLYGNREGQALAWRAVNLRTERGGVTFDALHEGVAMGSVHLQVPGAHNALNALAVLAVATELRVPFETVRAGLERFAGTARRFQRLGQAAGVTVIDDYAHHPTQIRTVLDAARQVFPEGRIIAVWEPHTFSRLRALWDDFLGAFEGADAVVILPIYAAREVNDGTLRNQDLVTALAHPNVTAAPSLEEAVGMLQRRVQAGDVVLLMGAGNEYVVGERLLEALEGEGR